ncbi:putative G-protein coupled receptor C02B8.5 [Toxocara canis]|uniref:Putative G-protein coupled receptor C02B8.5 n=1 Tax=Toxocara canis TaxID=6265 RepID=A0A0B2UIC6_TOXCA|nr:putative G-protein coupled receptor C02B8.5 [Toxocara canis]
MRSSTNLYLCALGCSDSAVICTAIFLFCIDSIRRYSLHLSLLFGALSPLVYPAGMTAQTCSVYFTLVAGADCFVQVCLPARCRSFVSQTLFVKFAVLFVVVFSVAYNIPHCFEAVVLECWHLNFQSRSLEVCPDPFRFLPTYMLIYYKYMYSLFLAVGPLAVLVILNLCIIGASVVSKTEGGGSSGDTIALVSSYALMAPFWLLPRITIACLQARHFGTIAFVGRELPLRRVLCWVTASVVSKTEGGGSSGDTIALVSSYALMAPFWLLPRITIACLQARHFGTIAFVGRELPLRRVLCWVTASVVSKTEGGGSSGDTIALVSSYALMAPFWLLPRITIACLQARHFGTIAFVGRELPLRRVLCWVTASVVSKTEGGGSSGDTIALVCLPARCRSFVSQTLFVKFAVLFVVVFSVAYNIPHCFEAVVLECWHLNFQSRSLEVCPDPFRFLPTYMLIYYKYMYSLFLAVGPLAVLVILNLCIIGASVVSKTEGGGSSGDTIALVLVVLLFIACNVAALLLNVFEARLADFLGPQINYVVDASNLLVVFNSSFNFVIYVTFSAAFRSTLLQYARKAKSLPYEKQATDECKQTSALLADHKAHRLVARKHTIGRLLTKTQPEVLI